MTQLYEFKVAENTKKKGISLQMVAFPFFIYLSEPIIDLG